LSPAPDSKFDRSVSLLSWAYNEESSIEEFLERAIVLMDSSVEDYEIVLIDDGSTDRTYEVAKSIQSRCPKLKIFQNEANLNVGISSRRAIQRATKDFLFWQTVDWGYDISDLRRHLEYLKQYDIVQGVRRKPVAVKVRLFKPIALFLRLFGIKHLTRRSDTISKAIVSVVNYMLIRLLFRIPVSDFQNVTFYPTKWIQSIKFEATSSFANPEGIIRSYWNGMTIKEVPINFIPRGTGEAKGTRTKAIMRSIRDILWLWFKWIVLGKAGKRMPGKVIRLDPTESE
jgi:glycosyltransferase involved in cell wall biosynthesis